MPGQIILEMTGDERKVIKSLKKLEGEVKVLETNLGKAGKSMKKEFNAAGESATKAGKSAKEAFDPKKIIAPLIGGLVGVGGVVEALRLVRAEFEKMKRIQGEAAVAQRTLAQARAELALNLPGKSPEQVVAIQARLGKLSTRVNVRESILTSATAQAVSAGAGNEDQAISATGLAAQLLPNNIAGVPVLAGSIVDLAAITKSKDPRVSAGLLLFTGGLGRVVNPLQQARNIPAALQSLVQLGGTTAGSGALFATLTTLAKDPLGESSRTASIQLARQLRDFLPDVATTQERIARVQRSPERRAEFLEKASFEARFAAPIEKLLTGGTEAAQLFASNLAAFPKTNQGFIDEVVATMARLNADPLAKTAKIGRVFGAGAERIRTIRLGAGRASVVREGLRGVLDATGRGALTGRIEDTLFEIEIGVGTQAPLDVAIPAIENRIRKVEGRGLDALTNAGLAISRPAPSTEDKAVVEVLTQMLGELREIKEATKQNGGGPTRIPASADFRHLGPNMLLME